jgi:hypothetical protein
MDAGNKAANQKPKKSDEAKKGCATSFLNLERGEIGSPCGPSEPNPEEEYVQSDKEREAGGEG